MTIGEAMVAGILLFICAAAWFMLLLASVGIVNALVLAVLITLVSGCVAYIIIYGP